MMHPSSNNNGYKPPKTSFFGNYYNDTNHSQDHYYTPSSFSSYLPSPNYIPLDESVFCDSFQHQQFFSNDHNHHDTINILPHEMTKNVESINMGECGSNNGQVARNDHGDDHELPYDFINTDHSPRKRHSKGDRHSKIDTARGPRDRRMRLSLDVAKKLFGLQDLLGYDKASKTVDWLITKSRSAILELLPDHQSCSFMGVSKSNTNSASSTSECEVLSGTVDESMLKTGDDQGTTKNKEKSTSGSSSKQKEKITKGVRKSADFHNPLAKATRERARARARERTIEKRNHKLSVDQDSKCRPCMDQAMDQDVNQLGSWSLFEENQCQPADQMSSQFQFKQGFVGDNPQLMMTAGNLSPSYLFNYQPIAGLTHEQHHLNEFQVIGKSWEGNNT